MEKLLGGISGIMLLFWIFLAILWFILPFVVFAIKDNLKRMENVLNSANAKLSDINQMRFILTSINDKLDKISISLDPETGKADLHSRHIESKKTDELGNQCR